VCDLCGNRMDEDHRHLLHVTDRRILCSCEPCWAMRAGDPELRPTGTRMQLLEGFDLSDELWAKFQIPIGLTFFFVTEASGVVALYPSPRGRPSRSSISRRGTTWWRPIPCWRGSSPRSRP